LSNRADFVDGKQITFSGVRSISTSSRIFTDYQTWGCDTKAPPQCTGDIDLLIIMDVSRGVSQDDFNLMKSFAASIASGLPIGNGIRIGLIAGSSTPS
jgi:hypothetical protein